MTTSLLLTAGLVTVLTNAQGLVAVLVVMAAWGVSSRSGGRAGVVVAATAGLAFLGSSAWTGRATGIGLVLTAAAVLLWMLIAWTIGVSVRHSDQLDEEIAGHVRELRHRALHDPLTGLANRDLLLDRLAAALERAERHSTSVAVLLLDLDNFKLINDSLGHAAGDHLLVQISQRLTDHLRGTDIAARFGGDEFALVCEDLCDDEESVRIAARINAALSPPFIIEDHEIPVTTSIGLAVPPSNHYAPDQLLQDADQAMYRAKERGGGQFFVFNDELRGRALHRLNTEIALRNAVDRQELRLVYQPIIDLTHNRISGVEALLRWQHPTRGLLVPADFLPIAERSSVMLDIGTWVLEEACAQATRWNRASHPLTTAVNVSLRQLTGGFFDAVLNQALDRSGADPNQIHLEITETTLLRATETMKKQLTQANDTGVSIGLDDFGTGFSSLSLIKDFPVRFLKIDKSFISGLGKDQDDDAITSAVLSLGHHLDLDTIAEGIETSDQLSRLRRLGCRYGQGYHLGRPQTAPHIQQLLNETATWCPAGT